MKDNTSIHISNTMKDLFDEQNFVLLDHPPITTDLNPIENDWGQLVRMIYANRMQYTSLVDLKASVCQNWKLIDQKYIQNLVLSMLSRIKQTLMNKGGFTNY